MLEVHVARLAFLHGHKRGAMTKMSGDELVTIEEVSKLCEPFGKVDFVRLPRAQSSQRRAWRPERHPTRGRSKPVES